MRCEADVEPKAKGKAKGLQAIADWADFDSNDAAAGSEDAEQGRVEEGEQDQKRARSKKVTSEVGFDYDGNRLPVDDTSPYTAQQKYVFDKTWKDLPELVQIEWSQAVAKKDSKRKNVIINSMIPKDAVYALVMSLRDPQALVSRIVTQTVEHSRLREHHGVTQTEAEGPAVSPRRS